MEKISRFLARFKDFSPPGKAIADVVRTIISEETGITLAPTAVRVQGDSVFVSSSSIERSEVAIKRGVILRKITERLGKKVVRDIR